MAGHDAAHPDARIVLSYGLIYMDPSFKSIDNVVIDNTYTSGANTPTYGSVDTGYRHTLGQEIGVHFKAFPDTAKSHLRRLDFLSSRSISLCRYRIFHRT